MANTLAALLKHTACSFANTFQSRIFQPQIIRHLYANSALGIDGYLQQCERTKIQLANISDKFRSKMTEYTSDDSKNMIFTEDLKNMVHLAESEEDVQLVIKMMKRFNGQNKQLRFGNFVFGPVAMRMFHVLNKPNEALESFKSADMLGFYDQLMSYQLLMNLLYENKKYSEVLEVYEIVKNKQLEGSKYPRNIVVLTLAACYKMNTPESLQFALNLWSDLNNAGNVPMRRAATFCAGLALNQGQSMAALEISSSTKNQNYTTIRNIKVSALTDLGRLDDAISILKSVLSQDSPDNQIQTFNKDVVEKVKNAIEKCDNAELKSEFSRIEKYFIDQGHLSEKTLDEQLSVNIITPAFIRQNKPEFNRYQRFPDSGRQNRTRNADTRPGLVELQ